MIKDKNIRVKEVVELRKKMIEIGLYDDLEGVPYFIGILNEFINSSEDVYGIIYLPDLNKQLVYNLFIHTNTNNMVVLKK